MRAVRALVSSFLYARQSATKVTVVGDIDRWGLMGTG